MRVGVQFTGTVPANTSQRWFTFNWPQNWNVVWTVVPVTPQPGTPQLDWSVSVERANASYVTYWITVRNISANPVNIEGRYAITN